MLFFVIFEIFTVKLAAAAKCTEFPELEGRTCPIASDATVQKSSCKCIKVK